MVEFVTIGVYGFDAGHFFQTLLDAQVDTLCDIRRRRGVRGAEYAFANSKRLQERLHQLNIRYLHRLDLAPPQALRAQQAAADEQTHTARRQRAALSPGFVEGYRRTVLAGFDPASLLDALGPQAQHVALLCVERQPDACHRSLLADYLHSTLGAPIRHLTPAA